MNTKSKLIAVCGINCSLCYAYQRKKNTCPGCRHLQGDMPISISNCKIRNCDLIKNEKVQYCYECQEYPCKPLKQLDKRYRTKYDMSEIENLEYIKKYGIRKFLKKEEEKWKCPACGGTICVHKKYCLVCQK